MIQGESKNLSLQVTLLLFLTLAQIQDMVDIICWLVAHDMVYALFPYMTSEQFFGQNVPLFDSYSLPIL